MGDGSEGAKPCPFFAQDGMPHEDGGLNLTVAFSLDESEAWVLCEDCQAQGPVTRIGCRDEEAEDIDLEAEAVELWNMRGEQR